MPPGDVWGRRFESFSVLSNCFCSFGAFCRRTYTWVSQGRSPVEGGLAYCLNAINSLRRSRFQPDLLGLLYRVRTFCLRAHSVRCGINVAVGQPSGRDFGTDARHCVGAHSLLCRCYRFDLDVLLHHPHRFHTLDHGVFGCCSMALAEAKLKLLVACVPGFHFACSHPSPKAGERVGHPAPGQPYCPVEAVKGSLPALVGILLQQ